METVLYDYNASTFTGIGTILSDGLVMIVPIGFFTYAVIHTVLRIKGERLEGLEIFFTVVGYVVGITIGIIGVLAMISDINEQAEFHRMLANDEVSVVEGYVENFHGEPWSGHDSEHFEIDGIIFEYSNYEIVNGYHTPASHGGVITHDGQHLKIKYLVVDEPMDGQPEDYYLRDKEPEEGDLPAYYEIVTDDDGNLVWRDRYILYIAELEDE